MIEFSSPLDFPTGTIAQLLRECYAPLKGHTKTSWDEFAQLFDEFEKEVHANPKVANCVFITCLDGQPIGLGSFDPRQKPAYGDIGHNCILPAYQGKGFGQKQILEILNRLRERGIQKARVSTGASDFALPARKMYESCGFVETHRFQDAWDDDMVEYEMQLL